MVSWRNYNLHDLAEDSSAVGNARHKDMKILRGVKSTAVIRIWIRRGIVFQARYSVGMQGRRDGTV